VLQSRPALEGMLDVLPVPLPTATLRVVTVRDLFALVT